MEFFTRIRTPGNSNSNSPTDNPDPLADPDGISTGSAVVVGAQGPVRSPTTPPHHGNNNNNSLPSFNQGNIGGHPPTPPTLMTVAPPQDLPGIVKPIMGDIVNLPGGTQIAWVGGKPNTSWTGLDPMTIPIPTPTMYRNVGSKDVKSFAYRTRGLEQKLTVKDDLRAMSRKIFNHLKQHGMDTISYIPDPANPSVMESVVEKPNLFTKDYVITKISNYTVLFDDYDCLNDRTAVDFLLAS
jgi:hypothetical protein